MSLDPQNGPAKLQLDATQKLLRRLQFEAAIAGKDEVPTSQKVRFVVLEPLSQAFVARHCRTHLSARAQITDQLAAGGSPIEADYTGPRLSSDGLPTAEFVDALIEWFKDGNVIPRRIAWQIVLGAFEKLKTEPSLVDVTVPEGETINV